MRDRSKTKICILTPALVPYDAISNDVFGMARCLRAAGYRTEVYAETVDPMRANLATALRDSPDRFWMDENTLVIYHHSVGWPEGQSIASQTKGPIVIRYHNVTPSRFFEPYVRDYAIACLGGEQATEELAKHQAAWFWGDSQFNCDDLIRYGANEERCRVLAPFHETESLAQQPLSLSTIRSLKEIDATKILFIGGLKPNKGHFQLIRTIAQCTYDGQNVVLLLPGNCDPRLAGYRDALVQFAAAAGVEERIRFIGPVTESELRTLYFGSDIFLCLSEHEGFCVPLVEAMHFRLPLIVSRAGAVPATVGSAAVIWDASELYHFAESISSLMEQSSYRRSLAEAGWERYWTHFSTEYLRNRFLGLLDEVLA